MTFRYDIETEVGTHADQVWAAVTRMDGVNAELHPYVRMTYPKTFADSTIADAPLGETAFGSWLLAFGFLPFDLHALKLDTVGDGRFVEVSSSWMQKVWRHERHVEPVGPGRARICDRLDVTPRLAFMEPLARRTVAFLFRHRHRRLKQIFGD